MNREIKFRAWDKVTKQGFYFTLEDVFYSRFFNHDRTRSWEVHDASRLLHESQYTGLKDKNGVEIYEGDIVTKPSLGYNYEVIFKSSSWLFARLAGNPARGREYIEPNYMGWFRHCEVIGNIYENPELLEAKS